MNIPVIEGDETHLPDPSFEERIIRSTLWPMGARQSRSPNSCDQDKEADYD